MPPKTRADRMPRGGRRSGRNAFPMNVLRCTNPTRRIQAKGENSFRPSCRSGPPSFDYLVACDPGPTNGPSLDSLLTEDGDDATTACVPGAAPGPSAGGLLRREDCTAAGGAHEPRIREDEAAGGNLAGGGQ